MQCESCEVIEGTLYCLGCKKYYCVPCDQSKHPGYHTSVSAQKEHTCIQHKVPISMYCESCDQLLCAECLQTHHAQYHHLLSVPAVYRNKSSQIQSIISTKGLAKREKLQQRIAGRILQTEQLQKTGIRITEQIEQTEQAILKRLYLTVAPWEQELEKELSFIRNNLQQYRKAVQIVKSENIVDFLLHYRDVIGSLQALADQEPFVEHEYDLTQIPREIDEMRRLASSYTELEALNESRNTMIWDLVSGNFRNTKGVMRREVSQWSRLTDRFIEKITATQLFCYFCSVPLDERNVNQPCRMNQRDSSAHFIKDPRIPPKQLNSGFHYFVRPQNKPVN